MGRLVKLQLENFKSYRGLQTIGPFYDFTAVIGPNGSGKSNLMDAISFVLGLKSTMLRSSQLIDFIYRSDLDSAQSCFVSAEYQLSDRTIQFKRCINAGKNEYYIDDELVDYNAYLEELDELGLKSRNFLVFQGDVEAIASQSPKELTKLIEQISGSLELKDDYDRLKSLQEKASENSSLNFNKKRTMNVEMKQFKDQKEDYLRFEKLTGQKAKLIKVMNLWKLYHAEEQLSDVKKQMENERNLLANLDREKAMVDGNVKDMKKAYAKANKEVLLLQKKLKDKTSEREDIVINFY